MTFSDLADNELVSAMASLRAAHPELDEYIRRQDARVASQREVTRRVLDVVASPAVAVVDLEATCYGTPQEAEGNASRFRQILVEYSKAPAVTRERLYLDMMQSVLGSTSKVLLDQKSNSLLYLPFDQLLKQSQAGAPAPATSTDASRAAQVPDASMPLDRGRELPRSRDRSDGR